MHIHPCRHTNTDRTHKPCQVRKMAFIEICKNHYLGKKGPNNEITFENNSCRYLTNSLEYKKVGEEKHKQTCNSFFIANLSKSSFRPYVDLIF